MIRALEKDKESPTGKNTSEIIHDSYLEGDLHEEYEHPDRIRKCSTTILNEFGYNLFEKVEEY
jgi:hypothetical protein